MFIIFITTYLKWGHNRIWALPDIITLFCNSLKVLKDLIYGTNMTLKCDHLKLRNPLISECSHSNLKTIKWINFCGFMFSAEKWPPCWCWYGKLKSQISACNLYTFLIILLRWLQLFFKMSFKLRVYEDCCGWNWN